MAVRCRPLALLAAALALLALASCDSEPDDGSVRPVATSVRDFGPHSLLLAAAYGYVPGLFGPTGAPQYVYVALVANHDYVLATKTCPRYTRGLVATIDGEELDEDARIPDAYGCDQPIFVLSLRDRLAELEARDTLEVVLRDAGGEMRMVLDNVIRAPSVTIASPPDGVVRRGEALDLAIGPSVDAAPVWIGVSQAVFASDGTHYVDAFPWEPQQFTDELVVDETHLRYIVPLEAPLGPSDLLMSFDRLYGDPDFAWRGRIYTCEGAEKCKTGRLRCDAGSDCGPLGSAGFALDQPKLRIDVVE